MLPRNSQKLVGRKILKYKPKRDIPISSFWVSARFQRFGNGTFDIFLISLFVLTPIKNSFSSLKYLNLAHLLSELLSSWNVLNWNK
jgi:hypothetical protein